MNTRYGLLWASLVGGTGLGLVAGLLSFLHQDKFLTARLFGLAWLQFQQVFNLVALAGILLVALVLLGARLFARSGGGSGRFRWPRGRLVLAVAVFFCLGINAAALGSRALSRRSLADLPSVVLISIDTIRADRLGCYGYDLDTTPCLDSLATAAVRFADVVVPMSHTLPAHASLLSGLEPGSHGVLMNGWDLPPGTVTLAEVLKNRGYLTAAFVGSVVLDRARGLARGFDLYDDALGAESSRLAQDVRTAAQEWLEKNGHQKFFLFIHFWDPHSPYDPPAPLDTMFQRPLAAAPPVPQDSRFGHANLRESLPGLAEPELPAAIRREIAAYDGEVRYVDQEIGLLLDALQRPGLWDETLVIVTGDHGEGLGERGWWGHELFFEEHILVPLLIKPAGKPITGRVVDRTVGLIDLAPTILEVLNLAPREPCDGQSLRALLQGPPPPASPPRAVFLERRHYPAVMRQQSPERWGLGKEYAVRAGGWKLIHKELEEDELYHLVTDPRELHDLVAAEPAVADSLREVLGEWLDSRPQQTEPRQDDLDPRTVEQLKSLGYIR